MIYYRHFRLVDHKKISAISLAGTFRDGKFFVGLTICSKKDNFCRTTGRKIAEERLINDPIEVSYKYIKKFTRYVYRDLFISSVFSETIEQIPIKHFSLDTLFGAAIYGPLNQD